MWAQSEWRVPKVSSGYTRWDRVLKLFLSVHSGTLCCLFPLRQMCPRQVPVVDSPVFPLRQMCLGQVPVFDSPVFPLRQTCPGQIPDYHAVFDAPAAELRWFLLPNEAKLMLHGTPVTLSPPFRPRVGAPTRGGCTKCVRAPRRGVHEEGNEKGRRLLSDPTLHFSTNSRSQRQAVIQGLYIDTWQHSVPFG